MARRAAAAAAVARRAAVARAAIAWRRRRCSRRVCCTKHSSRRWHSRRRTCPSSISTRRARRHGARIRAPFVLRHVTAACSCSGSQTATPPAPSYRSRRMQTCWRERRRARTTLTPTLLGGRPAERPGARILCTLLCLHRVHTPFGIPRVYTGLALVPQLLPVRFAETTSPRSVGRAPSDRPWTPTASSTTELVQATAVRLLLESDHTSPDRETHIVYPDQ
mmetsp:Transcript_55684/g.153160  ORF Transcript_55684/g.153160 Transcript_55684/m.153160 type:complete len:221 (+) Transcript_55684:2-664(+)